MTKEKGLYKRTKLVHGVGVNDADYTTQKREVLPDGKKKLVFLCPYYDRWVGLLKRCYSKTSEKVSPTYKDCYMCNEWIYFSNFKAWMEQQDWEGRDLDKDLLVDGNKVYGPETSLFLDKNVNRFSILRGNDRGEYPLGVSRNTGKVSFTATCNKDNKRVRLGTFYDPLEAHKAWQVAKLNQAIYLQSQQTCQRTVIGLQRIIDKLQDHIDNNIETKDL